jgi:hypothetical protein
VSRRSRVITETEAAWAELERDRPRPPKQAVVLTPDAGLRYQRAIQHYRREHNGNRPNPLIRRRLLIEAGGVIQRHPAPVA